MEPQSFATDGFALVPGLLGDAECAELCRTVSLSESNAAGARALLSTQWCERLARGLRERPELSEFLPPGYVAVQCTYFEKSPSRNWLVAVHQDLSIPVAERLENQALQGWSEKEGATFVQPPVQVLEQLVAIRLHLDECGIQDGPLRVIPGSHRNGRIDADRVATARRSEPEVLCIAPRGGALVMRPLLLHASSKSTGAGMRRVLHFVFGPPSLPLGLRWRHAV